MARTSSPAPPTKVSVGTTSIAGYGTTATAGILALVAFLSGDRSQNTVAGIVAGAVALASFVVTQVGRYWQARELAKAHNPQGGSSS